MHQSLPGRALGVRQTGPRPFPKAGLHGEIREILPDIFFVMGTVAMPGPVPVRFSRNMIVLRDGNALTLVHSLRLDDQGLSALEQLGKVEHVVRLAGFHGMDDPFYKDRYGATVWAIKGQVYAAGFKPEAKPDEAYFNADREMDDKTVLPISNARIITFKSAKGGEGLLYLERDGGVIVSGDALQNWQKPDQYFNFLGRLMMKSAGFVEPFNIGPGWLKFARPDPRELWALLDVPFQHVLPVHGDPVLGNARERYRPVIEGLVAKS